MATSLSKFVPKNSKELRPRKKLIHGRFHYKGKRLGHPRMVRGVSGNPAGVRKKPGTSYKDKHPYVKTGKPRGNPNMKKGGPRVAGRKKGTTNKYKITDLIMAIKAIEEADGVDLLEHFIRRALKSDPSLNNLMKKLLPDLKSVAAEVTEKPFSLIVET